MPSASRRGARAAAPGTRLTSLQAVGPPPGPPSAGRSGRRRGISGPRPFTLGAPVIALSVRPRRGRPGPHLLRLGLATWRSVYERAGRASAAWAGFFGWHAWNDLTWITGGAARRLGNRWGWDLAVHDAIIEAKPPALGLRPSRPATAKQAPRPSMARHNRGLTHLLRAADAASACLVPPCHP